MRKPTICICENKDADYCEADQRLCFRYSDSTVPLPLNPKFQASSSFLGWFMLDLFGNHIVGFSGDGSDGYNGLIFIE